MQQRTATCISLIRNLGEKQGESTPRILFSIWISWSHESSHSCRKKSWNHNASKMKQHDFDTVNLSLLGITSTKWKDILDYNAVYM